MRQTMRTITDAENLRQYKSTFSSTVEQILGFVSSTNRVREMKNVPSTFKRITCTFLKILIWIDRSILWLNLNQFYLTLSSYSLRVVDITYLFL